MIFDKGNVEDFDKELWDAFMLKKKDKNIISN